MGPSTPNAVGKKVYVDEERFRYLDVFLTAAAAFVAALALRKW